MHAASKNNPELKRKKRIIADFVKIHESLAKQGSAKWLDERRFIIGGSEIATIIGKNRFSNMQQLVAQKIGISSFDGNSATRWGSIFENVSEMIFGMIFTTDGKIHAMGSVPHPSIENHRYSPDGLCIVKVGGEYCIILLEFKSPFGSIPDKKIPVYYIPQIKAGLCTLTPVEKGIFVNNMYRRCTLEQLGTSNLYDKFYHKDTNKKLSLEAALCYGVVLFYIPANKRHLFDERYAAYRELLSTYDTESESESEGSDDFAYFYNSSDAESDDSWGGAAPGAVVDVTAPVLELIYNVIEHQRDIIDLGELPEGNMADFLQLVKPGDGDSFISVKYVKPTFNVHTIVRDDNFYVSPELAYIRDARYFDHFKRYNYKKTIDNFKNQCAAKDDILIAALPWKLFKSSNILVEKDPKYLDPYKESIDHTVDVVKKIMTTSTSLDEKINMFAEIYPDSDIVADYLSNRDWRDFI
jgi:hypothetical protein